ncbi:MAG: pectinesterase family protein [Corallococcus sp.]|nr:pectinesterase family protein [Corallococcus sp.]
MSVIYAQKGDNLQRIIDSLKPFDKLVIGKGVFRQKLKIRVPDVTICGESADQTVIVYGDYAKMTDCDGLELTTFKTASVAVCADGVTIENLSVINDAGNPETKGQEVALYVSSDRFFARDCTIVSTQDTLFCAPLPDDLVLRYDGFLKDELRYKEGCCRQVFTRCRICGTVDFIFGTGDALFDGCTVVSAYDVRKTGYVAAPAHSLKQTVGFVFDKCAFVCDDGVLPQSVYLARPWRDFGKATFVCCTYADHIAPCGFDKWNDTDRDRTARFYEYPLASDRVAWAKPLDEKSAARLAEFCKKYFAF